MAKTPGLKPLQIVKTSYEASLLKDPNELNVLTITEDEAIEIIIAFKLVEGEWGGISEGQKDIVEKILNAFPHIEWY